MPPRHRLALVLAILAAPAGVRPALAQNADHTLVVAAGSTMFESGLLDSLLPDFERRTGWRVRVVACRSDQCLRLGASGDADVLITQAPAAESAAVRAGQIARRRAMAFSSFALVGPAEDPASTLQAANTAAAMRQIAQRHARFLSRGDSSSTHEREVSLWRAGGGRPEWEGYAVTGRGMAATLREANERGAYTLTDETTFLAMRGELAIEMVRRPEPLLTDVHHLLEPVAGRRGADRVSGARALADWLLSPETQNRIGRWGVGRFQEAVFTAMRGIEQLPR